MVRKGSALSGGNLMPATILYLDTIPGDSIQETIFAGIRRYAASRKWDAAPVPREESRPETNKSVCWTKTSVALCLCVITRTFPSGR